MDLVSKIQYKILSIIITLYQHTSDKQVQRIYLLPSNISDCEANSLKWENVITNPQLPVGHGVQLKLSCPPDQINSGGDVAECKDGKLELISTKPPNCEFGKEDLSDIIAIIVL